MATGYRTLNEWVSMLPYGSTLKTILARAEAIGRSTGLVTDVSVYAASPVAFDGAFDNTELGAKLFYAVSGSAPN